MTVGQKMFMLAAQEMNFSAAAARAYVTPQCLSDHIHRLEEQYHVQLFTRKPHLQLTQEGKILLRSFKKMQAIEDSMTNELADISEGVRGLLRVGMPTTRADILVSRFVPQFAQKYPQVDVQIELGDTRYMEQRLLKGDIDLFLGVDAGEEPEFKRIACGEEPLYLIMPMSLLRRQYPEHWMWMYEQFLQDGADLSLLSDLPFVHSASSSTTVHLINRSLTLQSITLKVPIAVSSFSIQVQLCRNGDYATISSRCHLRQLFGTGVGRNLQDMLVFRIKNFDRTLPIEIVQLRDAPPLHYREEFCRMLKQEVQNSDMEVRKWLHAQGIQE